MEIHRTFRINDYETPPCVYATESPNGDKFLTILKHELHKELNKELNTKMSDNPDNFVYILKNEIKTASVNLDVLLNVKK